MKDLDADTRQLAVNKILTELDLIDYKESHPMSLSGGQKQRVAIASAIASKKELIIFDEPTSGLDYRHMKEVAESINHLSTMGTTQFIITHDPELVSACCNYFVFIENGKVTHSGYWTEKNSKLISDYFKML